MFYLVKTEDSRVEIINDADCEDERKAVLEKYLENNFIKELAETEKPMISGKYIRKKDGVYEVIKYVTQQDGWIFYGSNYEVFLYDLRWCPYPQKMDLEMLPLVRTDRVKIPSLRSDKSYAEVAEGPKLELNEN